MIKETRTIPLRIISRNDGQLDWLPKNPRQWTKEDIYRTQLSIEEDTDFLEDRPLLLVPDHKDGRFIVFAGNLRREGAKAAQLMEVPCVVYYPQNDEDKATIKRRAMKDNGSFGSWDFDILANEWDDLPLTDWGVPAWETDPKEMNLSTQGREGGEGYDEFVDKFKQKLTTDDCYTPTEVYDALLAWIDETIKPISRDKIVRPFFPGGDYANHNYPDGCVVIDNPPFSIYSEIVRFYAERKIPFFLFGPSLTLFGPGKLPGVCYIVSNASLVYENGAVVATSFVTNIIGNDDLIWVRGDLRERISEAQKKEDTELGRYDIPDNVLTSARIGKICSSAKSDLRIKFSEAEKIKQLDGFKEIGKGLYGGGFLLSRAAAERAAAERAAAERAAAERAAIKIQLSARELAIVAQMDKESTGEKKGPGTEN
jgi:hypothetical protein